MMTGLMLNTISAASIDSLEMAKKSLLNSNYYVETSFSNQGETESVSDFASEAEIYSSYQSSFVRFELEWTTINQVYNPLSFKTVFIDELEETQKTNEEKSVESRNKIIKLQEDLGSDLFKQLSYDQILLLINTAGIIKAGPIKINEIYEYIEG